MACRLPGVGSSSTVLALHLNDHFNPTTGKLEIEPWGGFWGLSTQATDEVLFGVWAG